MALATGPAVTIMWGRSGGKTQLGTAGYGWRQLS